MSNKLNDGGLEKWDDATHLTHWMEVGGGTSTVNREATEKIEGAFSVRLDIDFENSGAYVQQDFPLTSLKKYKLVGRYKNSIAGKTARIRFRDKGSNVYLKEDGTWNVGSYLINFPNSLVWKKIEILFYGHPDYSNYRIYLDRSIANSSSIYWDNVSIEEVPRTGLGIGLMNFDSGSVEPKIGEILRDVVSCASGRVAWVKKTSGSWSAGTAVGSIRLVECEGRFHDNSNINGDVGGANILTVNHPDTTQGVDLIRNGEFSVDNDPPNGWFQGDPADILTIEAGGKVGNCMMITEGGVVNPDARRNLAVTAGKTYRLEVYIKKGTEASYQITLWDHSGARNIISAAGEAETVWKPYSHIVKAPPGCFVMSVFLYQICSASAGTTIYYDEVSLYEITPGLKYLLKQWIGGCKTMFHSLFHKYE